MKLLSEKIKIAAIICLFNLSLGTAGCSTGTGEGETNVEESDAKDNNPNEHNRTTSIQPVPQDSAEIDDAYEKTDEAHDRDNDGLADQPKQ